MDATDDRVRAAHVLACESYSISAEGIAMMVFRIPEESGGRFAVTLPVTGLKALRTLVTDLISAAEKRDLTAGMVSLHRPRDVTVGNLYDVRNSVVAQFNSGAEDEIGFLMHDDLGLDLAEGLQQNIYGRMTDKERRERLAKKSKVLTAPKPRIILPGLKS